MYICKAAGATALDMQFYVLREQLEMMHLLFCLPMISNRLFSGVTSDLIRAYELSGKSQLSVMKVDGPDISKYGVIVPNAEGKSIIGLIEKPNIADAPSNLASIGRYVLTPDIFEILRELSNGAEGEIHWQTQ